MVAAALLAFVPWLAGGAPAAGLSQGQVAAAADGSAATIEDGQVPAGAAAAGAEGAAAGALGGFAAGLARVAFYALALVCALVAALNVVFAVMLYVVGDADARAGYPKFAFRFKMTMVPFYAISYLLWLAALARGAAPPILGEAPPVALCAALSFLMLLASAGYSVPALQNMKRKGAPANALLTLCQACQFVFVLDCASYLVFYLAVHGKVGSGNYALKV
jgi:hypothetical protein